MIASQINKVWFSSLGNKITNTISSMGKKKKTASLSKTLTIHKQRLGFSISLMFIKYENYEQEDEALEPNEIKLKEEGRKEKL